MIWITGAKGMLGRHLTEILLENDQNPICTDKDVDIGNVDSIESFYNNIHHNKNTNSNMQKRDSRIEYIINCAAYTAVDKAEEEKELNWNINCIGPGQLAKFCSRKKITLIHISTDYVFSGDNQEGYSEDNETNPLSEYGRSKLAGENNIVKNLKDYYIIRTSWLYGPYGNNFVKTMLKLFKQKSILNIINDQYGSPTYTGDLANTIIKLIQRKSDFGIYHFSNSEKTNWYEFAKKILLDGQQYLTKHTFDLKINPIKSFQFPQVAKRPKYSFLKTEKIESLLPYSIRPWPFALNDFFKDFYKKLEEELYSIPK